MAKRVTITPDDDEAPETIHPLDEDAFPGETFMEYVERKDMEDKEAADEARASRKQLPGKWEELERYDPHMGAD